MTIPTTYDFIRYLDAKAAIDDRALNAHVWSALATHVANLRPAGDRLRVLEMGAGTGSMIKRLARDGLLPAAHYVAIEASAESVTAGIARLRAWAHRNNLRYEAIHDGGRTSRIQGELQSNPVDAQINWVCADVFDWLACVHTQHVADLVVAHAFLDLVDAPRLLRLLASVTRPGSLHYFSLNFDGATILLPEVGDGIDEQIERLYHASMDARQVNGRRSGDSRTGRRLFTWLRDAAIDILAAGSSDWVIHAERGAYLGDAAYFLHHILHFVETSLSGAPGLNPALLETWLETRRNQIECGELVYIAHQLDFLGVRK